MITAALNVGDKFSLTSKPSEMLQIHWVSEPCIVNEKHQIYYALKGGGFMTAQYIIDNKSK